VPGILTIWQIGKLNQFKIQQLRAREFYEEKKLNLRIIYRTRVDELLRVIQKVNLLAEEKNYRSGGLFKKRILLKIWCGI
jgi:hypothetical protein